MLINGLLQKRHQGSHYVGIKDLTMFVHRLSPVFANRYLLEFHQRPTVPLGKECKATVKWRHLGANELKTNFDGGGVCGDQ